MAAELIGFENLPNVFIKQISVYDHSENEVKVKLHLSLQDNAENPVWYNTESVLTKLLQIGVVFSSDEEKINNLNSGTIDFKDGIMTKSLNKQVIASDYIVFDLTFENIVSKSIKNLNAYCFCFIDKKSVLEAHGIKMDKNYYGPIKGEIIYLNGVLNSNSFAFLKSDGTYWSGPVHAMGEQFMAGSYHGGSQDEMLTRILVKNTKIKDFREAKPKVNAHGKKLDNIVSELLVSYNGDTDVNSIFNINIKTLLKNNTKYGNFLKRASTEIVDQILEDFKINLLTIERNRVRIKKSPSTLRSKKETVQKVISKKNIIKTHDELGKIKTITRLEKNGIFNVVESELRPKPIDEVPKFQEIFLEQLSSYKKISKITELFLGYSKDVRTFQFNDYELTDKTPGIYKYKISFSFVDPFERFIRETYNSFILDISATKKYLSYTSRNRKLSDSETNMLGIVKSYIDKYSYLYSISNLEKSLMFNNLSNFLDPKSATVESVNRFLKKYENLFSEYSKILEYDGNKKKTFGQRINIQSKDFLSKRIQFQHEFSKLIEPSKNDVSFAYFDSNKSDQMQVFSKRQIQQRSDQEVENNFKQQPKVYSKKIRPIINTRLNDITSRRTTFFSPVLLKNSAKKFKFGLDSTVPHKEINSAFKKVAFRTPMGMKKILDFIIIPATTPIAEENTEQFVLASDSLGYSNGFVQYDESYDSFNIIDKNTEATEKLDNLNSGLNGERSFEDIQESSAKITEKEAEELPIQLKSVVMGNTDFSRTDFISSRNDLIADPETKNYFEINNFSVKRLVYIDGFQRDLQGNVLLNKPIIKEMTTSNFLSLNKPVVCKLMAYTNDLFKIYDNDIMGLNSVFILSDEDINNKDLAQSIAQQSNYNYSVISYEFMSSLIINQTNQPLVVKI